MTPLHSSAYLGHNSIVESLIKCGANVNAATVVSLATLHHNYYCYVLYCYLE